MAGKCHWSAAVELDAAHSRLRWDVACRVRGGELQWLGSSYQSDAIMQLLESHVAAIGEPCAAGDCGLRLAQETASAPGLTLDERRLRISASPCSASLGAATIRWSYVIEPIT
jgi:hypothetical protein